MPNTSITLLCLVMSVIDGDTLIARCSDDRNHKPLTVRVAYIDAPELTQPYAEWARQNLIHLCQRMVARVHALAVDRQGRTIARVQCNQQDAATAQLDAGLAWIYTRDAEQRMKLQHLEDRARKAHIGLWSQKRPTPPWVFRKNAPPPAILPKRPGLPAIAYDQRQE